MVSLASLLWKRFVLPLFMMNFITLLKRNRKTRKLKESSNSLRENLFLFLQKLVNAILESSLIICKGRTSTLSIKYFAGVQGEVNCNEFISYDNVTKKNTQIGRLSVLSAVQKHHEDTEYVFNVTHRTNMSNIFVRFHG